MTKSGRFLCLYFVISITLLMVGSATPQIDPASFLSAEAMERVRARAYGQQDFRIHYALMIREISVDHILAGITTHEIFFSANNTFSSGVAQREPLESALNETLVAWKSKGFPELLQKSSSSQLNDLKIKLEKGILMLDHKAGKLKDLAAGNSRQDDLATARLLEQRKTILMVILGSVKQAAAQKAASEGKNAVSEEAFKESDAEQVSERAAKPAPKAKPAPRRRQPKAGSPPPPELPAGGALSGN